MPGKFTAALVLTVAVNFFLLARLPAWAQNDTSDTIKIGYFTPPPSATATQTPTPFPTSTQSPLPTNNLNPTSKPTSTPVPTIHPVTSLVNAISKFCPGSRVTGSNFSCLDRVPLPVDKRDVVLTQLKDSAIHNDWLQCVGFVRGSTALMSGSPVNNGGNAINFATNVPDGYRFLKNKKGVSIKTNDLPIWDSGNYGHIAYVVKTFGGNNFQVAEANLGGSGLVRVRNTTTDSPNLIGWLRKI